MTIKLATLLLLRKGFNQVNGNISNIKRNLTGMTESHARFFKNDFNAETQRIARSFVGLMLALSAIAGASIIAILWIAASAWRSPNRDVILGVTMLVLIVIGLFLFAFIYFSWKKEPLFNKSMLLIQQDWYIFRGLDGTADTTDVND